MQKYKLIFKDNYGVEHADCLTDGSILYTTLRGYQFEGSSFNMFEPKISELESFQENFETIGNCICGVFILFIPLTIEIDNTNHIVELKLEFDYREEADIRASLVLQGIHYSSVDSFGWVEDALCHLQTLLHQNAHIHSCLTCAYSHYHPAGSNDLGSLLCLKAVKSTALNKVRDKQSLMDLLDADENNSLIDQVLEIHNCEQFKSPKKTDWLYKNSFL